jgi:hypothetical protein
LSDQLKVEAEQLALVWSETPDLILGKVLPKIAQLTI